MVQGLLDLHQDAQRLRMPREQCLNHGHTATDRQKPVLDDDETVHIKRWTDPNNDPTLTLFLILSLPKRGGLSEKRANAEYQTTDRWSKNSHIP